ncbi:MAG: thioredoxin family protein [Thermoanaerobaculaceae bacterium]|nr:thioredoxin family protein [Thermoanaerobaculaceae bacterium]
MNRTRIAALALPLLVLVSAGLTAGPAPQRAPVPAATPQELASLLGSGTWVIMEFGGEHCIPCMHMQPVLQDLRDAVGAKAVIRNFWIQDHPDVAERHKIMLMPTQVVFNPKGEEVFRHMGYFPPAEFQAALQKLGIL